MKRVLVLCAGFLFGGATVFSQVVINETSFGNKKQNAVSIEVNAPARDVEKALNQQFASAGIKGTKKRGVYTYNKINLNQLGSDALDVYTKIENAGNNKSIVYFSAIPPSGEMLNESSTLATNIQNYLYDFVRNQQYTSLDYDIYQASDSVRQDEEAYKTYEQRKADIERQQAALNSQMQKLEKEYQQNKQPYEMRRQRLNELKSRKINHSHNNSSPKKTKAAKKKNNADMLP